ncbi:NAD(P)H-dependent oxidoreductase [Calditerricola satsumensis]|uniref:NADPH-dependent FMN reductase-like domain-containing protein n=2 Tax=Calditerricola satsumensis TaxID=373054 RepID=A0A8J3BAD9_9BACI|nr:hypothetical protein GCM10007043_21450 [Calditerricola satsumensis]
MAIASGHKQFKNKPVAIAACAGGGKGGINALNNLRLVLRGVSALVLPSQLVAAPEAFDGGGNVIDAGGKQRLAALVDELVHMTRLLKGRIDKRAHPL